MNELALGLVATKNKLFNYNMRSINNFINESRNTTDDGYSIFDIRYIKSYKNFVREWKTVFKEIAADTARCLLLTDGDFRNLIKLDNGDGLIEFYRSTMKWMYMADGSEVNPEEWSASDDDIVIILWK